MEKTLISSFITNFWFKMDFKLIKKKIKLCSTVYTLYCSVGPLWQTNILKWMMVSKECKRSSCASLKYVRFIRSFTFFCLTSCAAWIYQQPCWHSQSCNSRSFQACWFNNDPVSLLYKMLKLGTWTMKLHNIYKNTPLMNAFLHREYFGLCKCPQSQYFCMFHVFCMSSLHFRVPKHKERFRFST